jgi:FkbM family methyltransferase
MKFIRLLRWSLKHDYTLLFRIRAIPIYQKISCIALKYLFYVKDKIVSNNTTPSRVRVFGDMYHYVDAYGIASLQRVYCESYHLKSHVKQGAVVIDVGAHIGQFNFFCRNYLKASRIVSIEPIRECYEVLKLNSRDPDDCMNIAISNERSSVHMHISKTSTQHSTYIMDDKEEYLGGFDIPAARLENVINEKQIEKCDLLKIDTEGSEYDVLLSAGNALKAIKTIYVEMSVLRKSSGNLFIIGTYLQDRGFALQELLPFNSVLAADGIFRNEML